MNEDKVQEIAEETSQNPALTLLATEAGKDICKASGMSEEEFTNLWP